MMNKILTVGHPQSGYRDVERILYSCGMQEPAASKKDNLSPLEIGNVLRKAHGFTSVVDPSQGEDIQQLDAGPVWNGLALDLLMGNIDKKFWGWSDPEALCLLDYWKTLDPKMAFVLVYDEPHRVLSSISSDEAIRCSSDVIEQRLDNWSAYNEALLRFHLRNQDRSLLVNARQVRKTADAYLNWLQLYLDDQLLLPGQPLRTWEHKPTFYRNGHNNGSTAIMAHALAVPALADTFLIDNILSDFPQHQHRYEELQASATMPLEALERTSPKPLDAWLMQMKRRSETGRVISILSTEKKELVLHLNELEEQKQAIESKLNAHQDEFSKLKQTSESSSKASKALKEENDLLLSQLHQVQEELERYYLENEKNKGLVEAKAGIEQKLKGLEAEKKGVEEKLKALQQQAGNEKSSLIAKQQSLEKEKNTLEEAKRGLESKLKDQQEQAAALKKTAESSSKALKEENGLLLSQLHQVQEELERYYLENQRLKQQYEPDYYGAADRLKSELPYQLGAAIIKRSRKVWPLTFLPLSITRLTRQHQKDHQATDELPPLTEYRDYHEAEKAQKHLSYRLGSTWLKHSRTPWGWVAMPFALTKAYREFRAYRASKDN